MSAGAGSAVSASGPVAAAPLRLSRVVLASGNAGKLREMQQLLAPSGVELVAQSALGIGEAEEPYDTFLENALAKARHASAQAGAPAIADDSGICVPSLGGAPGVRSARYAQREGEPRSDAANNALLVETLRGRDEAEHHAYYYCALVLVRSANDPQPIVADAIWHGRVIDTPRGTGGFGYDAYFLLPDLGRTAAELNAEEKNLASHRGRAMRELLAKLAQARLLG
jgi:XTP/dITP diphosphohydrolase